MLYNPTITDYNKFKEIFGSRKENGRIINKILLSFWKYRHKIDGDWRATQIISLNDLYNLVIIQISKRSRGWTEQRNVIQLSNYQFLYYSNKFSNPSYNLQDYRQIQFINAINNKKHTMKAGKFFRQILEEYRVKLDESTITYCSERFQQDWELKTKGLMEGIELHIDDNFDKIYSSKYLDGNFGSCMVDRSHYSFYAEKVKAKAAYLTKNNKIVARCILFTEVHQKDTDKIFRYAERQYAQEELYKTILIQKLIDAKEIDIYKTIGAGCSSITSIVDINGNSVENPYFWIECNLKNGDTISYMDTFRYYHKNSKVANNYNSQNSISIATTQPTISIR